MPQGVKRSGKSDYRFVILILVVLFFQTGERHREKKCIVKIGIA